MVSPQKHTLFILLVFDLQVSNLYRKKAQKLYFVYLRLKILRHMTSCPIKNMFFSEMTLTSYNAYLVFTLTKEIGQRYLFCYEHKQYEYDKILLKKYIKITRYATVQNKLQHTRVGVQHNSCTAKMFLFFFSQQNIACIFYKTCLFF